MRCVFAQCVFFVFLHFCLHAYNSQSDEARPHKPFDHGLYTKCTCRNVWLCSVYAQLTYKCVLNFPHDGLLAYLPFLPLIFGAPFGFATALKDFFFSLSTFAECAAATITSIAPPTASAGTAAALPTTAL